MDDKPAGHIHLIDYENDLVIDRELTDEEVEALLEVVHVVAD